MTKGGPVSVSTPRAALRLRVTKGPGTGAVRLFKPGKPYSVGRSEGADLCIPDAKISRLHCRLVAKGGGWFLEDLHSRNGTFVDGKRVGESKLRHGMAITLGKFTEFDVEIIPLGKVEKEEEAATPAPVPADAPPAIPDAMKDLQGTHLGEFKVIEPVQPLGAATYLRALQPSLSRHVMLAVFTDADMGKPGSAEALQAAVQMAAPILHPNVLQLFDFGRARGFTYVAMELFQGESLGAHLAEKGFVAIGDALNLAKQLVEAFSCGLDSGLEVGAISPDDLWMDPDYTLKLKLLHEPGQPPPPVSHFAYQAPEVLGGGDPTSESAAVYSVGALLYHMLAATPPVKGESRDEIARRARHDTPPPLR
ncbi:MAG: FHA domain-containing protein, partial [Planctomycetota bacterium]